MTPEMATKPTAEWWEKRAAWWQAKAEAAEAALALLNDERRNLIRNVFEHDDARKEALAALALQAQERQWQPIATAPTGAMILLCSMSNQIAASEWCWVDWIVSGVLHKKPFRKATHWMPLPEAPWASLPSAAAPVKENT